MYDFGDASTRRRRPPAAPASRDGGIGLRIAAAALATAAWLGSWGAPVVAASLVDEVAHAARSYHEEPARLDTLRAALDARLATSEDAPHLTAAARVNFLWAEVRAKTAEEKLAAYDRGRRLADRARHLAPKSAGAHFWFAVNTGRWAEAKGAWRALSTLRMLREEVQLALELDPGYTDGYAFLGAMYRRLPWFLGGDSSRAEAAYRKGLEQDPTYTGLRIGLAKILLASGRPAEARAELLLVIAEKAPRNRAEWTLEDSPEATRLLQAQ